MDTAKDFNRIINQKEYPYLNKYSHPVKRPNRKILGRNRQMRQILAIFDRPELSNVLLLADAGGGKTALVQGLMMADKNRVYLEIQLSKMIADAKTNSDRIAEWLRDMFSEASKFGHNSVHEVVLFIDEFHQIVQVSAAAVEVMKPLLADSGTRGIRVVAATTFDEYTQYLSKNQALIERFSRIQLPQPNEKTVIAILRNMANTYHVGQYFKNNRLFTLIYRYTNRYIPSQIQPRKSILVLDAMIGYHRAFNYPFNKKVLAQVLYDQQGVNVAFSADASKIEKVLNAHVIQQHIATKAIANRLQICIADLNDKSKPMASMLFTGSTGVGKTEMAKQMCQLLFNDSQQLVRFDMTEYSNNDSVDRFRNELTMRIWAHPYCILLLDEIEKAAPAVTRLLLQVLDDGRLSDRNNRTVSFINVYIIMTTNAGANIFKTIANYENAGDSDAENRLFLMRYENQIKSTISQGTGGNKFPPELLGRIDTIVPFRPLNEKTLKTIVIMHLKQLAKEIALKHSVKTMYSRNVITYLIGDTINLADSNSGGAREVMHKLDSEVIAPIAKFINMNPGPRTINVEIKGKMLATHKTQNISQAYVIVRDAKKEAQQKANAAKAEAARRAQLSQQQEGYSQPKVQPDYQNRQRTNINQPRPQYGQRQSIYQ